MTARHKEGTKVRRLLNDVVTTAQDIQQSQSQSSKMEQNSNL